MRMHLCSAVSTSGCFARGIHRSLLLDAETGDAEAHGLAGAQILWRFLSQADAGWGAGGNDIAGLEPHELADVGDQVRDAEEHGAGAAVLKTAAIDVQPELQVLRIGNFI